MSAAAATLSCALPAGRDRADGCGNMTERDPCVNHGRKPNGQRRADVQLTDLGVFTDPDDSVGFTYG